ncbi:MAG: Tim44 domain-containing protein [Alphaproteobacteria bacterium]|nr:Tim44 domain-containing protein [Alphaproteobacteria bacterium]
MSDGFPFFDIILFAMIAGFVILRLRSVLGRRTGHERRPPDPLTDGTETNDNVVSLPDRSNEPLDQQAEDQDALDDLPEDSLDAGLMRIKIADPSFDDREFSGGAKGAFEMIVQAFARGDEDTIRGLVSGPLYGGFVQAIEAREQAGETQETTIVNIRSADITEAELDGTEAKVTVEFVTEQVKVTRAKDGSVADGDPDKIELLTDIWTFARDVRTSDPNWELIAARVPEE